MSQPVGAAQLPPATSHVGEAFGLVKANIGGFLLSGVGFMGATFVGVMVCILVVFVPVIPAILTESEPLLMVGLVVGFSIYTVLLLLLVGVLTPLMWASLYRAYDAALAGRGSLGLTSAFSTLRQDALQVILCWFLMQTAVMIGAVLCYVPGLLLAAMLQLAIPLVAVRRLSAVAALKVGFEHAKAHLGWYLAVFFLALVMSMVLQYIPIVGLFLGMPFMVLVQAAALRHAFPETQRG